MTKQEPIQIEAGVSVIAVFDAVRETTPPPDLVTVAVSLFNYEKYVADCLDSVLKQQQENIDLIIVDDASNIDGSLETAKQWLETNHARFCRSLLVRHTRNQGLAQARNTGFALSRTDPVFVLDADNQIYPRALSRLLGFLEEGYSAAYSQLEFFGDEKRLGYADFWTKEFFKKGNYVDAMALVSKAAWHRVGGYTHMEGWEDFDFWCKFIDAELEAIFVPEVLGRYRVHSSSMLRTDTVAASQRLQTAMIFRHPWITW